MKKILALLLVAVMALSVFVACGESNTDTNTGSNAEVTNTNTNTEAGATNTDTGAAGTNSSSNTVVDTELNDSTIVGVWGMTMNLKDVAPTMGMDAEFTTYMEFTADKKVSVYMKESELWKAVEDATRSLMTKEYIAQQSGVSVAELEAALQQQGLTWEAFVEQSVETGLADLKNGDSRPFPAADANGNIPVSQGNFKVENGKIYISETETFTESQGASFTYENGIITISEDGVSVEMKKQ